MFVVLSATNRPGSNTLKIARLALARLQQHDAGARLLDLQELPADVLAPAAVYGPKPEGFAPFQQAILDAEGILVVVPEYNGSFPGIAKYFIDMLKFPESLLEVPVAFIGLSAGQWGANRSVEQLQNIFQYRSAHVYGRRVFLPGINKLIDADGQLTDAGLQQRMQDLVDGFYTFARATRAANTPAAF